MGKEGIKGEEKIGRVGEWREWNNVNSKKLWNERKNLGRMQNV